MAMANMDKSQNAVTITGPERREIWRETIQRKRVELVRNLDTSILRLIKCFSDEDRDQITTARKNGTKSQGVETLLNIIVTKDEWWTLFLSILRDECEQDWIADNLETAYEKVQSEYEEKGRTCFTFNNSTTVPSYGQEGSLIQPHVVNNVNQYYISNVYHGTPSLGNTPSLQDGDRSNDSGGRIPFKRLPSGETEMPEPSQLPKGANITLQVNLFDLRKSKIQAIKKHVFEVKLEDLETEWISVIRKHLNKEDPTIGGLGQKQLQWVATTKEAGNEIQACPQDLPLAVVCNMVHGVVILPPQRALEACFYVLHEGLHLLIVGMDDISVKDLSTYVATCEDIDSRIAPKLATNSTVLEPEQMILSVPYGKDQQYKIVHTVFADVRAVVLDVIGKGRIFTADIHVASTESALDVCKRTTRTLRENNLLAPDETICLLNWDCSAIVENDVLMQHVINRANLEASKPRGLAKWKRLMLKSLSKGELVNDDEDNDEEESLYFKAVSKTSSAFEVSISVGQTTYPLFVSPQTTVLEVKESVKTFKRDCDVSRQKIRVRSREFPDDATVEAMELKAGDTVFVHKRKPIALRLRWDLENEREETYLVKMYRGDTVKLLVSKASILVNHSERELAVSFEGKLLEEDKVLKNVDVQDQDLLHIKHFPNQTVLHIYAPDRKLYKEFVRDSQNFTMKTIINRAAAKLDCKAAQIFLVQHPIGKIVSESTKVADVLQQSTATRLTVHFKPAVSDETPEESYRFTCSGDQEIGIKPQCIVEMNNRTYVKEDKGAHAGGGGHV